MMSLLPNWGFRNTVHATHSKETVKLPLKPSKISTQSQSQSQPQSQSQSPDDETNTTTITLENLINTNVPELNNNARHNLSPMLPSGVLQNMYVAQIGASSYTNRFPVLFGRKLYVINDDILNGLKQSKDASVNGSERYSHFNAGQFSVDFALGFDDHHGVGVGVGVGDKESQRKFAERAKETLPHGFPKLHSNARYFEDFEIDQLFDSWFCEKLTNDCSESGAGPSDGAGSSDGFKNTTADNEESLVVVVPGIGGGINEPQVRSLVYHLLQKGKHVAVINGRGCCRTPITTPYLTTALHTDDLRYLVDSLHLKFPGKPIHLIGFSFGGVLMTNYIVEEATFRTAETMITSVTSICKPEDFGTAYHHLDQTFFGRAVFHKAISFFLMNMIKNNRKVLCHHLDYCDEDDILRNYQNFKTGAQVDDKYTCQMAGFPTATAYHFAISPIMKTLKIKTPMLILNTLDDPFTGSNYPYFDVQRNPYLYMATCDLGGHYCFIQRDGDFWFSEAVTRFVDAFDHLVDCNGHVDDGGFDPKQTGFRDRVVLY
ncbi:unnamed protein product [Ambrosiozyma monospora]|uniref:Unnamed protein product n=1 Tax=Ambrosiozyma monospora TaxID=43982 RepID=A0A9W6YWE4_AMBMO|nr:unnamed protein product [Ambrosiozyma monospora]